MVRSARRVAADDGSPLLLGGDNASGSSTVLRMAATGRVGLLVEADGAFNAAIRGSALAENGTGIEGEAVLAVGTGVSGISADGTGVFAGSSSGVALKVSGRVQATQAGIAIVPQGKRVVTVGSQVVAGSAVIASINGVPQPGVYVAAARVLLPDKVVIALNTRATKPTKVAFFVVERAS
jgi:hypothetical protein